MTVGSGPEVFDAEELLALARLALENNQIESALQKLKKLVADADAPADSLALAARVYAQLRLFEKAAKLYESYLEKRPDALLERFQLGMTRFDAGNLAEALKVWEAVLKQQPDYPPALFYRSLALSYAGKTMEAKPILEALLKSIPADNLYFGRAKELLQAIEAGRVAPPVAKSGNGEDAKRAAAAVPPNAYRTEH